jgi:plastocyanin
MYEPPKSTPMMDKPPKSTPMMDKPPKSTTPMPEPPQKQTSDTPKPPKPTPKPSYGSGSNPWSPSYDDCVQSESDLCILVDGALIALTECIAKHGAPTEHTWTPPKEDKKPGAKPTHTVMVAPVDGVPRFLPFALNATVGDTVRFIWTGKNQHSATMSSNLSVCNKSKVADAFDSGLLSGKDGQKTCEYFKLPLKGMQLMCVRVVEVQVKNDQPMWFFCTFGNHCNKGMFGGVNLKSSFGDQKSVGVMMTKWVQSSPDLQAAWTYVQNKTAGTSAEKWGNSISVADIPEDKHMDIAQNILWTRVNLAENPGMQDTGSAQTPDNSPLKLVGDISTLLAETNTPQAAQQQQQPVSASKPPAPSATDSKKSGALPSYSSAAVVSVLALLASVLVM